MTYGLPLNGDGDDKCLTMLNAVEETLCRKLHASRAPSSKSRVVEGSYSSCSNLLVFHLVLRIVLSEGFGGAVWIG